MKKESWLAAQFRENPHAGKRYRAGRAVLAAVKKGQLVRPKICSRCALPSKPDHFGRPCPIQAHHADYDKPLDVEWLCKACHAAEHNVLRKAADTARRARLRDPAHRIRVAS